MLVQATEIKPGDEIIHPSTGETLMVRLTTWSGHTVELSFYGSRHRPLAMSKTAYINKTDKE